MANARREIILLHWSTVRERGLTEGYSFIMENAKYACVCMQKNEAARKRCMYRGTKSERERERERQRDRETERETETERQRETETVRERQRERQRQSERDRER